MIGERLHRARKAADLSLRSLADEVGVSHTWINKFEKNQAMPDSRVLLKLGKALGVRSEYFFRPETVALSQVEYRKRSSLPQKRLQAITHEILDHVERRMELEGLFPNPPVEKFSLPNFADNRIQVLDQVEASADLLREEWELGMNPIPSMIDLLETNGVRVFCIDARNDEKFDGLLAYVADAPVVVVGKCWPGDRQRFTMAHELGHIILADRINAALDLEKACHRFAGALLFPETSAKKILGTRRTSLESRELQTLKHEYGLSMAAILRRAYDLKIITKEYFTSCNMLFRKNGWHKKEPGPAAPSEQGHVFTSMVFHALAEEYIGDSKAAELLGMTLPAFRRYRGMDDVDAAACQ